MSRLISRWTPWLVVMIAIAGPSIFAAPDDAESSVLGDEQTLKAAGLATDGPALLAFFHARARTEIDRDRLHVLLHQFAADSKEDRGAATAELLGLGPLALPGLRQTANDLDHPEAAERASRCLRWLEGPASCDLLAAAARVLAQRKPEGAAGALLAYLPCADNPDVVRAIAAALAAVAAPNGKPDPALLRGLADPLAVRRAAAGIALSRAVPPDQVPAVRKLLQDPAPGVRLRAAMALAEARDAEAIPVLIGLLADLPVEQRRPIEEFLTQLAGEWAPVLQFGTEDEVSRRIRRDAWAAWWRHTDGASLLAALRKHTLTPENRDKVRGLIAKLGGEEFTTRENASKELFALGRICLPELRGALKNTDPEVARRAKELIESIEREPAHHLPVAAIRLLVVRKPAGSVEALLAYLPHAEDETRSEEVRKSLTGLAQRDGKPDPLLLRALEDEQPLVRGTAARALAHGGGAEGRSAIRKLLQDDAPIVRLQTALALALVKEREAVPVLIDLLTVLPDDQLGQAEDALYQLAGETAPQVSLGTQPAERKKCRDAWAAWWKVNNARVDLARLTERPMLGLTLICNDGRNRVFEIDRHGKERWAIEGVPGPVDAIVLPGNRVLIAECNASRVTERDFKGKILWQKQVNAPVNVQRFANGNTFIASQNHIEEVDRAGKVIYSINNVPGGVLAAYRSRKGHIVCLTHNGQCLFLDTTGKQLKSFAAGHDGNCLGGLDLLPNGRILIPQRARNKVVEFDSEGKSLLEVNAPAPTMATKLPNGHILAASRNTSRVFEVDRAGKVVWEQRYTGQVFRVRRR